MRTNTSPTHILLIAPDAGEIAVLRELLVSSGAILRRFQLEVATTLDAGITRLRGGGVDVALLDVDRADPRHLKSLSALHTQRTDVPIIALTDTDEESTTVELLSRGAQDILVKSTLNPTLLVRTIRSAIERQQLLARLEQTSEERFRRLIEYNADGMIVVDARGIVQYANPAAELILERLAMEMVGEPFYFALAANTSMEVKIPCKGRESREKIAQLRVTEIEWDRQPALLAAIRDISELQRIEQLKAEVSEQRRLDQLKDEFVSNVSHELRTPLAIIKSAIDNLMDGVMGPLPADQRHVLDIAQRNVDRLAKLVNNLLDLSRLESGQIQPKFRALTPTKFVSDVLTQWHMVAQERGITLHADLPIHLPAMHADPDLLTQALGNLLANALRFAKTSVTVEMRELTGPLELHSSVPTVTASGVQIPPHGICITVRDDGPGIPHAALSRLFQRFSQLQNSQGGGGSSGTGLGLAITRQIIALHGGAIWAESPSGGGARFSCVLPLAHRRDAATKK